MKLSIHLSKSKEYLVKTPHFLGEHAFWFTVGLIGLAAFLSASVFFFEVVSKDQHLSMVPAPVELKKDLFEDILQFRKVQDQEAQDSLKSLPKDIFRLSR